MLRLSRYLLASQCVFCVILFGCQDSAEPAAPMDVVDVSTDAKTVDEGPDLPPPYVPKTLDECGTVCADSPLYVMHRIEFSAVADDGTSYGFDLDGEDETCDVTDLETSDGRTGIDNRLGELLAVLPAAAVDVLPGIVQTSIDSGQCTMIVEAVGIDDFQPKTETLLVLRMGLGTALQGADGHLLASQTFGLDPDPILGVSETAQVGGGGLTAGPFQVEIRLTYLGNKIKFRLFRGLVSFTHDPLIDTISGTLGGVVPLEDVTALANLLGGDDTDVRDLLLQLLPEFVDSQTVENGPCDGLSAAVTFEGIRAFIFED
jgi:hypothetical protein